MTTKTTQRIILEAIAKTINTQDSSYLNSLITEETVLEGNRLNNQQGLNNIIECFETLIANHEISGLPVYAEMADVDNDGQNIPGVLVVMDEYPHQYIMVKANEDGVAESIFISQDQVDFQEAEGNGMLPGFDIGRYKIKESNLWSERKAKALSLGIVHRPHFVGVIGDDQDPTVMMLVLDELSRTFEGSSVELHIFKPPFVRNTDGDGNVIEIVTSAEKAMDSIQGKGFPCLGVMLGSECIRPAYRGWNPDQITEDLIRMGVNLHVPCSPEYRLAS